MATAAHIEAEARVIAAWNEYLEACRSAKHPWRYDEVESWAWARLQQQLRELELRD
jgi:hypothetical protein